MLPLRLKLLFFPQNSPTERLGGISVIGLGRYCFNISVAANRMKLSGVFTEFGLSKFMKQTQPRIRSDFGVKRHTSLAQLRVLSGPHWHDLKSGGLKMTGTCIYMYILY